MAPMNETLPKHEPESLIPDRPPYLLLRARVAGDTIRDLIEALQQLDPDLKHDVQVVRRDNLRIGFQGERTRVVLETSR